MSDPSAQLPEPNLHENSMPDLEIELALGVHKALPEVKMVFDGGVFHPLARWSEDQTDLVKRTSILMHWKFRSCPFHRWKRSVEGNGERGRSGEGPSLVKRCFSQPPAVTRTSIQPSPELSEYSSNPTRSINLYQILGRFVRDELVLEAKILNHRIDLLHVRPSLI
jgi:hypothetical protein